MGSNVRTKSQWCRTAAGTSCLVEFDEAFTAGCRWVRVKGVIAIDSSILAWGITNWKVLLANNNIGTTMSTTIPVVVAEIAVAPTTFATAYASDVQCGAMQNAVAWLLPTTGPTSTPTTAAAA